MRNEGNTKIILVQLQGIKLLLYPAISTHRDLVLGSFKEVYNFDSECCDITIKNLILIMIKESNSEKKIHLKCILPNKYKGEDLMFLAKEGLCFLINILSTLLKIFCFPLLGH